MYARAPPDKDKGKNDEVCVKENESFADEDLADGIDDLTIRMANVRGTIVI